MEKKRMIAIGDVHGCIEELLQLLQDVQYNPATDQLIFLGDYVDKGPSPRLVVEQVMNLVHHDGAIALGGNHERIFLNWLHNNDYKRTPYFHRRVGGKKTVASFYPFPLETLDDEAQARKYIWDHYRPVIEFLQSRPSYFERDDYLFVHAGINPALLNWQETSEHDFRWIREPFLFNSNTVNKTIVFGHTVTFKLHNNERNFQAWICENKVGIDGGCVYGGNLTALTIENDQQTFQYVRKLDLKNEME